MMRMPALTVCGLAVVAYPGTAALFTIQRNRRLILTSD